MKVHFPKWLLQQAFTLAYSPQVKRFRVVLLGREGFGDSVAKAAKNARGRCRVSKDRGYKTLPGAPSLRKIRDKKQGGSLIAAVRYKI